MEPIREPKKWDKLIYIKEEFFGQMERGLKTVELRINRGFFARLLVGDSFYFRKFNNARLEVQVVRRAVYETLEGVIRGEDMSRILPGVDFSDLSAIPDEYRNFFNENEVGRYGLVALEVKKLGKLYNDIAK